MPIEYYTCNMCGQPIEAMTDGSWRHIGLITPRHPATPGEAHHNIAALTAEVAAEVLRAEGLHAPLNSLHEAYAVILEEVDELWDHVKVNQKRRQPAEIRKELIQIAAMAVRTLHNLEATEFRK